jgi:hypothetical protein
MNPNDRDLCAELLAPPPPSELTPLRERVWKRMARRLRLRRLLRRALLAAALAACWAAGMLTMHWWPGAQPVAQGRQIGEPPAPTPPAPPPTPALAQEWKAFDSTDGQADLYRRAAAAYLTQEHDPLSAVRCYGRALDAAPEQAHNLSADDDWLLMAIKDARKKENVHAKAVD